MDSAARNFLALAAISVVLAADAICGLLAYVVMPLLSGPASPDLVHLLPIFILGALLIASAWLGASALHRGVSASRLLVSRIRALAVPLSAELLAGAEAAGLAGRVELLEAEAGFSFVYGLARPRVAISRGLLERLSRAELRAALEHESYHVRNRDPLRALIAAVLVDALFLLPSLAVLRDRYEASRELAADRSAEEHCGRRPLIGALLKALEAPQWSKGTTTAPLGDPDLLAMRLARIETGRVPPASTGGMIGLAWSLLGTTTAAVFFAAAIVGVGGSAALAEAISAQLSPSGAAFAALCVTPAIAVAVAGYLLSLAPTCTLRRHSPAVQDHG